MVQSKAGVAGRSDLPLVPVLLEAHRESQAPRRAHTIDGGVENASAVDRRGKAGGLDDERGFIDVNPVVTELPTSNDVEPLLLRLAIAGNVHQGLLWLEQELKRVDTRRDHRRMVGVQGDDDCRSIRSLRHVSHGSLRTAQVRQSGRRPSHRRPSGSRYQ